MKIDEIVGMSLKEGNCQECTYVLGSKLPLFLIIGDGHQPNSRGLYTHYKDSL